MPDPTEPGHIPGQNPNTPERLQGEMKIGERGFPWLIGLGIAAAVISALFLIYGSIAVDPGAKPESSVTREKATQ